MGRPAEAPARDDQATEASGAFAGITLVVSPAPGGDLAAWAAFAAALGHCSPRLVDGEIEAAVRRARAATGGTVVVIASGVNALHALSAAQDLDPPPPLVLVSPAPPPHGEYLRYRGEGASKLFLVGNADVETTEELARASIGWAATVVFPSPLGDSDLLTQWFDHIVDQVEGFALQEAASHGDNRNGEDR